MFLARKINKVPARTYGSCCATKRAIWSSNTAPGWCWPNALWSCLKAGTPSPRGLFYSQIMKVEGQGLTAAMLLPPRYRGHEQELVSIYGLAGVRDAGLRAAFRWLADLAGFSGKPETAPA